MFGLSTKEVLGKSILNATQNCIPQYKESVRHLIAEMYKTGNGDIDERDINRVRKEFLDEVADSVFNTFQISSPAVFQRIMMILMSPSICGYDINVDNGMIAGSVFAICYHAIKNKVAAPKDCIRLNHLQNDMMQRALIEIEAEMRREGLT